MINKKKYLSKNWKKVLLLIIILTPFYFNRTHSVIFDINTDAYVIGTLLQKDTPGDNFHYPFGYRKYSIIIEKDKLLRLSHNHFTFRKYLFDFAELENVNRKKDLHISSYDSHYGLPGHFYLFIYNQLDDTFKLKNVPFRQKVFILKFFQSVLFTVIIAFLLFLIYKQYGINWLVAFGIPFLFSAYIPKFANHLGLGFTIGFFIPLLLSILIVRYKKYFFYILPAYSLIFIIKSLSGYEFMSTIILSGTFFPLFHFFNEKSKKEKVRYVKMIGWIGGFSFVGFLIAFLYHASLRGETINEGIKNILVEDGLRRTFDTSFLSSENNFSNSFQLIFKSLFKFLMLSWSYNYLFYGISGMFLFPLMLFFTLKIKASEYKKNKNILTIIEPLFFIFIGLSWILLAFNHAYGHYDVMLNIIWFFGTIQYCIYVIITRYNIVERVRKFILTLK